MATANGTHTAWTIEDLAERLGDMPAVRVHFDPIPGTATEEDLFAHMDRVDKCLTELYDGMMVDKARSPRVGIASLHPNFRNLTVDDLLDKFGPIPLERLRFNALPGTATEEDLRAILDREKCLLELVDGFLVEKTMGWFEGYLALEIGRLIGNYLREHRLGVVAGADGLYRMNPSMLRLPDVSFIPFDRLPNRRVPHVRICPFIPALVVEVLSKSNSRKEMDDKLIEYFSSGVLLVWYVDPASKTARVFTSPLDVQLFDETQTLDGGNILPGFTMRLSELFDDAILEDADPE